MPLFCSHCGSQNENEAKACVKCEASIGHVTSTEPWQGQPEDHDSASNSPMMWGITALVCGIYLINPTLGVFEFIPDNIPVIGNLDEAAATTGLFLALAKLGLNPFWKK